MFDASAMAYEQNVAATAAIVSRRYLGPVRDALKDEAEQLLRLLYGPLTTA